MLALCVAGSVPVSTATCTSVSSACTLESSDVAVAWSMMLAARGTWVTLVGWLGCCRGCPMQRGMMGVRYMQVLCGQGCCSMRLYAKYKLAVSTRSVSVTLHFFRGYTRVYLICGGVEC